MQSNEHNIFRPLGIGSTEGTQGQRYTREHKEVERRLQGRRHKAGHHNALALQSNELVTENQAPRSPTLVEFSELQGRSVADSRPPEPQAHGYQSQNKSHYGKTETGFHHPSHTRLLRASFQT